MLAKPEVRFSSSSVQAWPIDRRILDQRMLRVGAELRRQGCPFYLGPALVPFPQSRDVRCFITDITGAWSSIRNSATEQPFAEIYVGPASDLPLRVSPAGDPRDRVGA